MIITLKISLIHLMFLFIINYNHTDHQDPIATKLISNNETLIVEFKDEPHDLETKIMRKN